MNLPPRHPKPPLGPAGHVVPHRPQEPARHTVASTAPSGALPAAPPPFSAPRHPRSSASLRALLAGGRPHRRRPARGGAGQVGDTPDLPEDNSAQAADPRSSSLSLRNSLGGQEGREQQQQGRQQERQFARVAQARRHAPDPELQNVLARLLADMRDARSIDEMAKALRTAIGSSLPGLAPALVGVARQWIATQADRPQLERPDLVQVKGALLRAAAGIEGAAAATREGRQELVNLWLPVYLLNLNRPRSTAQQSQAQQRMALIARALGRSVDPAGRR